MAGSFRKRRNKDGSISWQISLPDGYGRGVTRAYRTFRTRRDSENPPRGAVELLEQMKREAETGGISPQHLRVNELLDQWLAQGTDHLAPRTVYGYRRIVERLRMVRPDIALSSDFIVGFPGETDADFRATMTLIEETGFIQAYSFKYSPRPGTPAAAIPDQVDEGLKVERLAELQELLNNQQLTFNRQCVGRVMPVLLDRHGRRPGQLVGRSPYMQPVHVNAGDSQLGTIGEFAIQAGYANSLSGIAVSGAGAAP